jgi:peptidoglycan/xylan/chitin deacetylase (PgdA/CDA1 family)
MIITYHEVIPGDSKYIYSLTASRFAEHVRFAEEVSGRRSLQITFDDGHISQYEHALPILERHKAKATFFITAGWTNCKPGYMNWSMLRELTALGHNVQAHGWGHVLLTSCKPAELNDELHRSKCVLEDGLGIPVKEISMPGGRWNREVASSCARNGYTRAYISDPFFGERTIAGMAVFGRAMVQRGTDVHKLERFLHVEGARWSRERTVYQLKKAARRTLGDKAYHRLWLTLGNSKSRASFPDELR